MINKNKNEINLSRKRCKSQKDIIQLHLFLSNSNHIQRKQIENNQFFHFQLLNTYETYQEYVTLFSNKNTIGYDWFIVSKVIELTKEIDCVCELFDEDGQFLLIECNEQIPFDISTENDSNKVFIKNGMIYISNESYSNPLLIDKKYENESITTMIKQKIEKHSHLFEIHHIIGIGKKEMIEFMNTHCEIYNDISNLFIDNVLTIDYIGNEIIIEEKQNKSNSKHENTFKENQNEIKNGEECQIKMNRFIYYKYYNYLTQLQQYLPYKQIFGQMLEKGFEYLLSHNETFYNYQQQYSLFLQSYEQNESTEKKELKEDEINFLYLTEILETYTDLLQTDQIESIIQEDVDELLSLQSDINGFIGKSDHLNQQGTINNEVFDNLLDELIDDLNEPFEPNENESFDSEELQLEKELMSQLDTLLQNQHDVNSSINSFSESLQNDDLNISSSLLLHSLK